MAHVTKLTPWQLNLVRLASVITFFAVWEAATRIGAIKPFLLPAPSLILEQLRDEFLTGELTAQLQATLARMFAGFLIAAAVGVPLGICLARIAAVRWFFDPLLSIALPMPQIAFLPIFILWLGVADAAKIALITFSAIFPIIVQTWAGTQGIDKFMTWSAQSLGVTPRAFLWEIALPAALPQIFTGLQVALPIALITTIVAEMLMGGTGVGGSIINGMRMSDSPELFGGIVAVAVVGYILTKAMEYLRRHLLAWHQEAQGS
jgi:ABC-type nitrate/sulfonate/bicarbonate transport system permease component